MNRCFSCAGPADAGKKMHKKCIKNLFGVTYIPQTDLTLNEVTVKAQEMADKISISGVQAKLSMKLNRKSKKLLPIASGAEYILKPQVNTYREVPENENLCMSIAGQLGINTPPHTLIKLKDGSYAYIIKRFDRINGDKINQEDFCQVLGKSKEDKYRGSVEQIAGKLKEISEIPALDIQYLYERVLFSFLIGNGDAHLKNYSVNYTKTADVRLSPAYDILSSKLLIPKEEDFALALNGKKNNLRKSDFEEFSGRFNIPWKITEKILEEKQIFFDLIADSQLSPDYKEKLSGIVSERFSRFK